jgi:hypothetical protein
VHHVQTWGTTSKLKGATKGIAVDTFIPKLTRPERRHLEHKWVS